MNAHSLSVLEFTKVRTLVASWARSEAGRDEVALLDPSAEQELVALRLQETREYLRLLQSSEVPPLDDIRDPRTALGKLSVAGSLLTPGELLSVVSVLAAARRLKKFFQRLSGKAARLEAPLLFRRTEGIIILKEIEDAVLAAVDEQAEVRDAASPELRRIRRAIVRMRDEILKRMTGLLQDSAHQKVIQEQVITVRDERYVLPLKPNFRQSLQGVVHGQSSSRATLFVEPLEVLEQNNRLAELRMEEREEVERILRELTRRIAAEREALCTSFDAVTAIDAIQARARFGIEYEAVVPELSPDNSIQLQAARHPLLVDKARGRAEHAAIMPNDIVLQKEQRALILSGPNAGGKTVVLKTLGLLCLMAQSGLPVTASEGSRLPCFRSVFADIGDEQSLEQDLSTFSSHVGRIAEILRDASPDSLVLLDELGAGTEPAEGAGLGTAVLEQLIARGCVTVVTTHHNMLKLFGSEAQGAVNAAMEFDPQSLKPTYRMFMGRPGRSYGLDMASRMGVPTAIIQRARERTGQGDVRLETLLEKTEREVRQLEEERRELEERLAQAARDRSEAAERLQTAREQAVAVMQKAKADSREIVAALRQKLRELSRAAAVERAEVQKASAEVAAVVGDLDRQSTPERPIRREQDIKPGSRVRLPNLSKTGTVTSAQGGTLVIEVAGKTVRISSSEVALLEEGGGKGPEPAPGWGADLLEREGAADRVNIIGLRVPEGLATVERFLDRAGVHHLSQVTIIHGLGTGALRSAVAEYLKQQPVVASFRSGEPAEGGAGVTVVELKK